jgi:hypothetical protein
MRKAVDTADVLMDCKNVALEALNFLSRLLLKVEILWHINLIQGAFTNKASIILETENSKRQKKMCPRKVLSFSHVFHSSRSTKKQVEQRFIGIIVEQNPIIWI